MNLRQNKVQLQTHKPHQRLWFSSILTLFIFATSISAYFLVKNSQDIRKSAFDPYANDCTCIYNNTCSVVNMIPCEGQCNPSCSPPAICCQKSKKTPTCEETCYRGFSCRMMGKDSATGTCSSGSVCCQTKASSQTNTCEGSCYPAALCSEVGKVDASGGCLDNSICCKEPPTSTCEGTCYANSSCGAIGKVDASGTCIYSTSVCCKEKSTSTVSVCSVGARECITTRTGKYCNNAGTAWYAFNCFNGTICQNGQCVLACQGTCYSNSSCSAIGKISVNGVCPSSASVCCQ